MTDQEQFVELLRKFGVKFDDEDGVLLIDQNGKTVVGDPDCFITATFNNDGSFKRFGAWM